MRLRRTIKYIRVFCKAFVAFAEARGFSKEDDEALKVEARLYIDEMKTPEQPDEVVHIGDDELYVRFNPYVHLFDGIPGTVAAVHPTYESGHYWVFVDAIFRKLSPEGQQTMLAHELGHLKLKHRVPLNYSQQRVTAAKQGLVMMPEYEADSYAATCIGTAAVIGGLTEMGNRLHGVGKKEVQLRINLLTENLSTK